jgi:hypothetical protein
MLFKEFYSIKEVSTCGDLKAAKNFAYSEFDPKYLGEKIKSFTHEIKGEQVPITMYDYTYDEDRASEMLQNYIWIDDRNKNKVAQLSYITLKVKLENSFKNIISEKYFFVVEEYRGSRLITPIYEMILHLNKVSPSMLVSDVKQSPSMNKFWKAYLIPKYKADPLISTKVGSSTYWTLANSEEGKRQITRLSALGKINIPDYNEKTKLKPDDDAINGDEDFNEEKFRILIRS